MSRLKSREILILFAIIAIAAFFRFYRLDSIPPGFQFDQAFNAFDILRLLQGQFAIFFPANTGREPLYFYLLMPSVALFGPTAFAIKLTSAIIGLITIPLIYGFARALFSPSPGSVRIAALTALFAAISLWHVFFSRDGLRVILEVPLTLLTFWYLWRALSFPPLPNRERAGRKSSRASSNSISNEFPPRDDLRGVRVRRDFALAGFFLALALYTYPSGRLLPIASIILSMYAALSDRARAAVYLKGLLVSLVVAGVLFLPLGIYFLFHPDQFISHTEQISVFTSRVNEGNILAAIYGNFLAVAQMFLIKGDEGSIHNLPGRPIFDPMLGTLFVIGATIFLVTLFHPRSTRIDRKKSIFIATWLLVTLASSLFSDDAPNFLRTLPALPALMVLPAWAAAEIWARLRAPVARQAATVVFGAMIAASTVLTYRDYFIVFANLPGLYYTFDVDKVEVSTWINQNARSQHIYLAPLWYQQGTISLLTRNAPLKSFESRDTIVLPSSADGMDALFAFPPEQERKVQTMAARLGALGTREELSGSNGGKLLLLYRVPAKNLPDPQNPLNALTPGDAFIQPQKIERANWENQLELFGYAVSPGGLDVRNLTVNLFLHALKPMEEDYTFSVKVLDEKDRVWGQEDKWPGDNSYATLLWSAGDVVIEKFYPGLNACAPAGDYRITVEAYNPKTLKVLALTDRPGNVVALGTTHAEASQSNRLEDLEPDRNVDVQVGERLHLIGYTLSTDQVRLGDEFSLSLFWRGSGIESTEKMIVRMKGAGQQDSVLIETQVKTPPEGRGLCSFFDFRVPSDFAPGPATIWVNNSELAGLKLTK